MHANPTNNNPNAAAGAPPPAGPRTTPALLPPYVIYGADAQLLQLTLQPNEEAHCPEPGNFIYCSDGCTLEQRPRVGNEGWFGRLLAGQGLDDVYRNLTPDLQFVALSIPQAGKVVPVELAPGAPPLLVQSESYLCSLGPVTHQRMQLQAYPPLSEQLPMQRIAHNSGAAGSGTGSGGKATVFVQAGGTIVVKKLRENESMFVHTACLAALTEGVTVHPPVRGAPVVAAGGVHYYGAAPAAFGHAWSRKINTACVVRGPGTVYLSNLPRSRMSKGVLLARGGGADALPAVKLARAFLGLMVLGTVLAFIQVISLEHLEL